LISLLILSGCISTAIEPNTVRTVLEQGQTQTISLGLNQTAIVEIASNPTTGYRWELHLLTRERRCYIVEERPSETSKASQHQPMRAGAPSFQQWSIKIDPDFPCMQDQLISWTYRRAWEPRDIQNPIARLLLKPPPQSISPTK
jgi:predicted secreted protein